jgi:hypothetical protein
MIMSTLRKHEKDDKGLYSIFIRMSNDNYSKHNTINLNMIKVRRLGRLQA